MKATIKQLENFNIKDPKFGDVNLNLFPIDHDGSDVNYLPEHFKMWEQPLNEILSKVPVCEKSSNRHYVTIDSKFFTTKEYLRREGIHIDGNFCGDPNFKNKTWGGTHTTWGGARMDKAIVKTDWVSPYDVKIPIGTYVSSKLGGLFCVSTEVGCQGWYGDFTPDIVDQGSCENILDELHDDNKMVFDKNTLYFMSSNTPHETLLIDKGKRRTLLRLTLAHDYENKQLKI